MLTFDIWYYLILSVSLKNLAKFVLYDGMQMHQEINVNMI